MIFQAAGFGVLAAISPTALLVLSFYLTAANPRKMVILYLAGAIVMTVLMAVALVIVIRATGLDLPHQRELRYDFRLALGILALAAAAVLMRLRPASASERRRKSFVDRLIERPAPSVAFAAGIVLFAPSASFIAAIQVVATARAGTTVTAGVVAMVVLLTIAVIWVPFLAYLARPHAVTRWITGCIGWIRRNGRWLTEAALLICGLALVINGSLGLATS
jgi:hypothetical protein